MRIKDYQDYLLVGSWFNNLVPDTKYALTNQAISRWNSIRLNNGYNRLRINGYNMLSFKDPFFRTKDTIHYKRKSYNLYRLVDDVRFDICLGFYYLHEILFDINNIITVE